MVLAGVAGVIVPYSYTLLTSWLNTQVRGGGRGATLALGRPDGSWPGRWPDQTWLQFVVCKPREAANQKKTGKALEVLTSVSPRRPM